MIIADKNSEHYKKVTHDKWKIAAPGISMEQAIYCEDILLEFVNGKKEETAALGQINIYLEANGLIEKKQNINHMIKLIELLNTCSPIRAASYMFFITVLTYIIISKLTDGIINILFVLKGYNKGKKNKKNDENLE